MKKKLIQDNGPDLVVALGGDPDYKNMEFTFAGSEEKLQIIDDVAKKLGVNSYPSAGSRKIKVDDTGFGPDRLVTEINKIAKVRIIPIGMAVAIGRSF